MNDRRGTDCGGGIDTADAADTDGSIETDRTRDTDNPADSNAREFCGSLEPCARCETPVIGVVSRGPHDHYALPCGCRTPGLE